MIERICPKCKVPMNGDKCIKPNCNSNTKISSTIYWCKECNVPVYDNICPTCGCNAKYISTDIRPVFPEENALISIILHNDPKFYQKSSVWHGGGAYIVDGKKVRLSIKKINQYSIEAIKKIKKVYDDFSTHISYKYFDLHIKKFVRANQNRYNYITEEATSFVQQYLDKYAVNDMMVSFSGGKDSTVTSHIVNRALGTNKVLHIFGDTTLEFPYTLEYKKRFNKNEESKGIRILTAKNREKNFENLCEIVGPPSRVMRWCCTVFKTGAIQKTISSAFKDKNNILSFQGIRHNESASRSKYERESVNSKISKQTVVSPIIDWIDFDVWLYILTTGIDFNYAYRLGWTRVGCWCCPNNGSLIGSANATNSGLSIGQRGNMEICSLTNIESKDVDKIDNIFLDSILVDDDILTNMKEQLKKAKDLNKERKLDWDLSITKLFKPKINTLFSYEFPQNGEILNNEYLSFLDITYDGDLNKVKNALRCSNVYLWLTQTLKNNGGCLYFGALSQKLHNAIVTDPKPYRKEVKTMLSNLLEFIEFLNMEEITIDRPNYSQRIKLVQND